jgi:hypothetical protein
MGYLQCSEAQGAQSAFAGTRGDIRLESTVIDNITLFPFSGVATIRDRGVASLGEPGSALAWPKSSRPS